MDAALNALIESQIDTMTKIVLAQNPEMAAEQARYRARKLLEQAAAGDEIQQAIAEQERRKAVVEAEKRKLAQQQQRESERLSRQRIGEIFGGR